MVKCHCHTASTTAVDAVAPTDDSRRGRSVHGAIVVRLLLFFFCLFEHDKNIIVYHFVFLSSLISSWYFHYYFSTSESLTRAEKRWLHRIARFYRGDDDIGATVFFMYTTTITTSTTNAAPSPCLVWVSPEVRLLVHVHPSVICNRFVTFQTPLQPFANRPPSLPIAAASRVLTFCQHFKCR